MATKLASVMLPLQSIPKFRSIGHLRATAVTPVSDIEVPPTQRVVSLLHPSLMATRLASEIFLHCDKFMVSSSGQLRARAMTLTSVILLPRGICTYRISGQYLAREQIPWSVTPAQFWRSIIRIPGHPWARATIPRSDAELCDRWTVSRWGQPLANAQSPSSICCLHSFMWKVCSSGQPAASATRPFSVNAL